MLISPVFDSAHGGQNFCVCKAAIAEKDHRRTYAERGRYAEMFGMQAASSGSLGGDRHGRPMLMILNLRSAREWNSALEDADSMALLESSACAESASAYGAYSCHCPHGGLAAQANISPYDHFRPYAEDLALQEHYRRAVQFLQRRNLSAVLETDWRVLTSYNLEEGLRDRAGTEACGEPSGAPRTEQRRPLAGQRSPTVFTGSGFLFDRANCGLSCHSARGIELTNAEIPRKGFLSQVRWSKSRRMRGKLAMPGRTSTSVQKESAPAPTLPALIASLRTLGLTDWTSFRGCKFVRAALAQVRRRLRQNGKSRQVRLSRGSCAISEEIRPE